MSDDLVTESFFDRTLRNLRGAWSEVSDQTRYYLTGAPRPDLSGDDLGRVRQQMLDCLDARGGEVSARQRAAELGRSYLSLNKEGRAKFLSLIAEEFGADRDRVDAGLLAVQNAQNPVARAKEERALRSALEPEWRRLLTRFTALPEGVKFLVDLRAELLPLARKSDALRALDADLKELLAAWFDIGFLSLTQITWDAPASLLEKLIEYEAVHAIKSWDDLKNRLDNDRRCFAFFHPNMPDEPLIFVEVALVTGMSGNVLELLDEDAPRSDPKTANTAIFYSISNAQSGLAGISFGNFLIKRVVDLLQAELPNLKTFATLSPIPGFASWLAKERTAEDFRVGLSANERKAILAALELDDDGAPGIELIDQVLAHENWHTHADLAEAVKPPLQRLAARYLALAKRPNGGALDPVAHFHLANGARMERLNWLGDTSRKGLQQSAGMMINYLYRLSDIDDNHEAYSDIRQVAMSSSIKALAKP
jgi:malonyl-CoA decarboxylase